MTNRLSLDYQICKITLFSNRTRSIFHLSRVNRLKFSSCWDFILVKMDKKVLLKGFLSIFFCYWGYFIWKFAWGFFFGTIHPFLGWFVDIVRSLRLNLFQFSPFWGFILVKIAKKLLLKGWILRGRGRGKKEPLARKLHDFEKLRSPRNAASGWCSASSVDILSTRNINQTRYALLTCATDLICGHRLQLL